MLRAGTAMLEIGLLTPPGAPIQYRVEVSAGALAADLFKIRVVESLGIADGSSLEWAIRRGDHGSYLELFDALARNFGLRRPLNRSAPASAPSQARFHVLLDRDNPPKGIMYGYGDPAV